MEISLLTSKFTLVPSNFFDPSLSRDILAGVVRLEENETADHIAIPQYDAVLVYSGNSESVTTYIRETDISGEDRPLPEMFYILRDLPDCQEYNKILCTWRDGTLFMGIAQGRNLLLANAFKAADFTTAEYYIFLALKSFQLNPEVSTICWRQELGQEEQMSLYRYFKAVEIL